jgi:hypothetical protein
MYKNLKLDETCNKCLTGHGVKRRDLASVHFRMKKKLSQCPSIRVRVLTDKNTEPKVMIGGDNTSYGVYLLKINVDTLICVLCLSCRCA